MPRKIVGGDATEQEPKKVPSFSALVAGEAEKPTVEGELPPQATPIESEPAPQGKGEKTYDFDAEWTKLPDDLRNGFLTRFNENYAESLRNQFGDLVPLVQEVQKNPNLRATLAAAASDPELREYLADPRSREELKHLTKKELREFLFGDGTNPESALKFFHDHQRSVPAAPESKPDPHLERINALDKKFQADIDDRGHREYVSNRQREVQALINEFPELKGNDKHLRHVLEWAENRFEQAAMRAGIVTDLARNPSWTAQALRAGIKPPAYREAQAYYSEVLGKPKTPSAPATSAASEPSTPQAPRSATEGKTRALALLKKNGGFNTMVKPRR